MYDPGFPYLRPLLYGVGGIAFVAGAFAIGFVIARPGAPETVRVEERTATVAEPPADEVLVVQPAARRARFPAFAPEGVIVVDAPSVPERAFAAATPTTGPQAETARRRPRLSERRPPVTVAEVAEEAEPQTALDEPRQPTRNEAPPAREVEEPEYAEAQTEEEDARSWYGSEEYRREVEERRRAERQARRRRW